MYRRSGGGGRSTFHCVFLVLRASWFLLYVVLYSGVSSTFGFFKGAGARAKGGCGGRHVDHGFLGHMGMFASEEGRGEWSGMVVGSPTGGLGGTRMQTQQNIGLELGLRRQKNGHAMNWVMALGLSLQADTKGPGFGDDLTASSREDPYLHPIPKNWVFLIEEHIQRPMGNLSSRAAWG
jgi:hypothetical protein